MSTSKKKPGDDITKANQQVSRGEDAGKQRPSGPHIGQPAAGIALEVEADPAGDSETEKALERATSDDETRKR